MATLHDERDALTVANRQRKVKGHFAHLTNAGLCVPAIVFHTELPIGVVARTGDASVLHQRAAVRATEGRERNAAQILDLRWVPNFSACISKSELPHIVGTPAINGTAVL